MHVCQMDKSGLSKVVLGPPGYAPDVLKTLPREWPLPSLRSAAPRSSLGHQSHRCRSSGRVPLYGGASMKTLREIMRPSFLFLVQKTAMVLEAVRAMTEHNVGIVVVLDGDALVGVFSERDVVQ